MTRFFYLCYRFVFVLKRWCQQHMTAAGQLVLVSICVSALFGIDTKVNLAYQIFCFLVALFFIAFATSTLLPSRFTVTRRLSHFASVGSPFTYGADILNTGKKTEKSLFVVEDLPDPRPSLETFSHAREPDEMLRNSFDRWAGYYRWCWLIIEGQPAKTAPRVMPDIPPNCSVSVRMELMPMRRGYLRLESLTIFRREPLGLFNSRRRIPLLDRIVVLPKIYPVSPVTLPGMRQFQPGGVTLASSVGDAEEFISLREYRPGDPLRHIHWKSWAKTGKPIVKEYQEEFFVRHALVLDTFHLISGDTVFEAAVSVAASLVVSMQAEESLLDLLFVGPEAYCFSTGRGLTNIDHMLEILAAVDVCTDHTFTSLYPLIIQRANFLSACICVFLDWDTPRWELVSCLQNMGVPVKVIVINDPGTALRPKGPMQDTPEHFHCLYSDQIEKGLAAL